jgi:hypothetical protein
MKLKPDHAPTNFREGEIIPAWIVKTGIAVVVKPHCGYRRIAPEPRKLKPHQNSDIIVNIARTAVTRPKLRIGRNPSRLALVRGDTVDNKARMIVES